MAATLVKAGNVFVVERIDVEDPSIEARTVLSCPSAAMAES
jgi:hypothetical protein